MMRLPWQRPKVDQEALVRLFARVFRGEDGEAALTHLLGMTMHQACGPAVTDGHLRHLEGQRFMVNHIVQLVERGRQ